MKYEVRWSSPRQGIQSTQVEALGMIQAREQVESMYYHIEGFRISTISPVFEEQTYSEYEESYHESDDNYGSGNADISSTIGGIGILIGGLLILLGMFSLPVGILAMIIGGGIGFLSWKIACWLSDRGW